MSKQDLSWGTALVKGLVVYPVKFILFMMGTVFLGLIALIVFLVYRALGKEVPANVQAALPNRKAE